MVLAMELTTSPANIKPTQKPKAIIYIDAYADEEFRHDKTYCRQWKPCLERLLTKVERSFAEQLKHSKRFNKHYSKLDFVIKNTKPWQSPNIKSNPLLASAHFALEEFMKQHKIKSNETDFRVAFTNQLLLDALGRSYKIPSRYVLVKANKHLEDVLRHELGHAFGLYHNDTPNNQMHHLKFFPKPKFSQAALEILADRIHSIIIARDFKRSTDFSTLVCELQSPRYLEQSPLGIIKVKDYASLDYELSINASGSFSIEYYQTSKKAKPPTIIYKLKQYLNSLGIDDKDSSIILYNANFSTNNLTFFHSTLNIDSETFLRYNQPILSWLKKNKLISPIAKTEIENVIKASSLSDLRLYDCIMYSTK
ncbi:hypothetical protein D6777_04510 [Candidatus Woesearchaeota archaeon]|nr:MAG: hypothetical protein D6777_04510 [Candidatus Woesearchaeota archaeon]